MKTEGKEPFEYNHPKGMLTLILDHKIKELVLVSFTPMENIDPKKTRSIDFYFKQGKYVGWGTGQKGWKEDSPVK